jgi:hypothetical protein
VATEPWRETCWCEGSAAHAACTSAVAHSACHTLRDAHPGATHPPSVPSHAFLCSCLPVFSCCSCACVPVLVSLCSSCLPVFSCSSCAHAFLCSHAFPVHPPTSEGLAAGQPAGGLRSHLLHLPRNLAQPRQPAVPEGASQLSPIMRMRVARMHAARPLPHRPGPWRMHQRTKTHACADAHVRAAQPRACGAFGCRPPNASAAPPTHSLSPCAVQVVTEGGHLGRFHVRHGSGLDPAAWVPLRPPGPGLRGPGAPAAAGPLPLGAAAGHVPVWEHTFVLMMEVLDNLPHDR